MKILLVEDSPSDAELCVRELTRSGLSVVSRCVDTREAFEKALAEFDPDLILSDLSLPGNFDGLAALDIAQRKRPETPFIFVSGTIGEERAVDAVKRGATDYVLKDRLQRLAPVVTRALRETEERAARRKAEEDISRQRLFLRQIIDLNPNLIFAKDREGRFVLVNQAVTDAYGTTVDKLLGKTDADFNPNADEVEHFRRVDLEVIDTLREVFIPEERITDATGRVRWLQTIKRPIVSGSGVADMVLGVATDITERKAQEERIARLGRIQRVLSDINSTIVRVRDRENLFREACRIAVEGGGFKLAWVGLLDRQTLDIGPHVWMGDERGLLGMIRLSAREDVPHGRGVSGTAIRTRKLVVVNDVANDDRLVHKRETLLSGFRSFIVLPLLVESEPIGALYFYMDETGFFDQDEVKLLVELANDISYALEYIEKEDRLNYLAYYDALTGLPNRHLFYERVNQSLQSARRDNGKMALVVLDLQRFGIVNDTLGRQAGDAVLKEIAKRLRHALEDRHPLARISADTFAIMLVDIKEEADVAHIIEQKIIDAVSRPFSVAGQELRSSIRCGVALFPGDGADADTMFRNAEAARKNAKRSGDGYLFYAPQMNARVAEKLSLENRLRIAIAEEQFVLHYQPKVDIVSNRVAGLEALIRWQSPDLGMVPPHRFIPLLEETGMILDVGRWVIKRAVCDYRQWAARGLRPPRIAVNISSLQLRQKDFAEEVKKAVAQERSDTLMIDLEITESLIMENIEQCIVELDVIKAAGMGIAIDDFGTGYSSLSYLARLPVSSLKIDRSFIVDMANEPDNMVIVSAIISLAHSLNLTVIAEGVETPEQLNLLKLLKCDGMQGYLFSEPRPAAAVEAFFPGAG